MDTGQHDVQARDELRFFKRLPWEKITTWVIFLLIIYALRNFFDILIVTFILSYIAKNVVQVVCEPLGPRGQQVWVRRTVVALVFGLFVIGIFAFGSVLIPTIYHQAGNILRRLSAADESDAAPASPPAKAESGDAHSASVGEDALARGLQPEVQEKILKDALRQWLGPERYESLSRTEAFELLIDGALRITASKLSQLMEKAGEYLQKLVTLFFHFLLSIVFSFLIVWDLPKLGHTTIRIPEGRFRDFCREIIPSLLTFSSVMGRAFQAQTLIALCNTVLTFCGLLFLRVENEYFLSVVVFLCSFIPVLGVFMSTVPMSLVALQQQNGGFGLVLQVILMVTLLHLIEAYVLNPRIMGVKFKMNPIVVLVILFAGEHFFGVWGLLLGVPLCYYLFYYVIQGNEDPAVRHSGLWKSLYPERAGVSPE
ncbi:MAG: AI-2E family transporter [Planctomycetes bacterium]|nr:AI-2E family transporter [Planctomycetota bacterium]